MRVMCQATIPDSRQRENLYECIDVVGADYYTKNDTVYAEFDGVRERGELLASIFRNYPDHGISILS